MSDRTPREEEPQDRSALPSFEESLERLERIVKELEGEGLTLEETLQRYEEGARLVRQCTRRLEEAELTVRRIAGEMEPPAERPGTEEAGEDEDPDERLPF